MKLSATYGSLPILYVAEQIPGNVKHCETITSSTYCTDTARHIRAVYLSWFAERPCLLKNSGRAVRNGMRPPNAAAMSPCWRLSGPPAGATEPKLGQCSSRTTWSEGFSTGSGIIRTAVDSFRPLGFYLLEKSFS